MSVKIRLARRGRKKLAIFDIVVSDARSPRDGKFIEKIGQYNPNTNPASINLKDERALYWLLVGAQPTDTTKHLLSHKGILLKKHLQVGVNKGAITQEVADARFQTWLDSKEAKTTGKVDTLAAAKDAVKKAAFDAEKKKNEVRAAAIAAANAPVVEVAAPVEEVVAAPVAEAVSAPVVEEVKAAAAPVTEAVETVSAPVVEEVKAAAAPVTEAVEAVSAPVVEEVKAVSAPIVEAVKAAAAPVVEEVKAAAAPVTEAVEAVVAPVAETAVAQVEEVAKAAVAHVAEVVEAAVAPVAEAAAEATKE